MTVHRRTGLILAGIAVTRLVVFVFVVPVLLSGDRGPAAEAGVAG